MTGWQTSTQRFQSTLPRGERRHRASTGLCDENFNPRSHEGSDVKRIYSCVDFANFNPRSHEGSDPCRSQEEVPRMVYFNPRSHEGSDEDEHITPEQAHKFQSTLPRGERRLSASVLSYSLIFQSTLPRGERHYLLRSCPIH